MAIMSGGGGKLIMMLGDTEFETDIADFEINTSEDSVSETIYIVGLCGATMSCTFEPNPELTEPLGLVDQITWGPRLN